jgi:hypothetical protein
VFFGRAALAVLNNGRRAGELGSWKNRLERIALRGIGGSLHVGTDHAIIGRPTSGSSSLPQFEDCLGRHIAKVRQLGYNP